jgi:hypothetical protein
MTPAFEIPAEEFRVIFRNRLILDHPFLPLGLSCSCSHKNDQPHVDTKGIHLQKCKLKNQLTITTHDTVKETLRECIKACGTHCKSEIAGLLQPTSANEIDNGRPDLIVLSDGSPITCIDVQITNAIPSRLPNTSTKLIKPGIRALSAEKLKTDKYKNRCERQHMSFIPAIFEVQGRFGEKILDFLNNLFKKKSSDSGIAFSFLQNYWFRRISVTLQKGVARAIITRARNLLTDSTKFNESFSNEAVLAQTQTHTRGIYNGKIFTILHLVQFSYLDFCFINFCCFSFHFCLSSIWIYFCSY